MPQLLNLSLSRERERVERERSTARVERCCRVYDVERCARQAGKLQLASAQQQQLALTASPDTAVLHSSTHHSLDCRQA
jgi:hypothetical protein